MQIFLGQLLHMHRQPSIHFSQLMRCTATHLTALCEPQSLPIESVGYRILKGSPLAHAAQESVTYVQVAATLTTLNWTMRVIYTFLYIETYILIAWCGSEVVFTCKTRRLGNLYITYKALFRRGPLCRILSPLEIYKLVCKHINCRTPKIFNTPPLTNFLNEAQHTCTCIRRDNSMSTVCIMSISQCSARFHLP